MQTMHKLKAMGAFFKQGKIKPHKRSNYDYAIERGILWIHHKKAGAKWLVERINDKYVFTMYIKTGKVNRKEQISDTMEQATSTAMRRPEMFGRGSIYRKL